MPKSPDTHAIFKPASVADMSSLSKLLSSLLLRLAAKALEMLTAYMLTLEDLTVCNHL